ncbi:MAG: META domain-containing protein [Rikenellaceae bacterium]
MKRITILAVVALIAIATIACCPCRKSSSNNDFNLASTSWQLTQLNSRSIPAVEDQYTLTLGDDGRAAGVALCNNITGSYSFSAEARTLKFDHMGMTRMMCPPGSADYEDAYGKMLGSVTHYEVDGDMLVLLSNGNSVAVFRRL